MEGERRKQRRVYISTRVRVEKYGGVFVKVEEEGHFPSPISFFSAGREYDPLLYSPLQHFILGKVVLSLRSSFIPLHDGNKLFSPSSKNQTDEGGGVISFSLSHRNVLRRLFDRCNALKWLFRVPFFFIRFECQDPIYLSIQKGRFMTLYFPSRGNIGSWLITIIYISLWRRVISREVDKRTQ